MSNKNIGWQILNMTEAKAAETEFTVVVSGLGRSGTTMVGKALTAGGLFMGVKMANVIHEDIGLSNGIENGDLAAVRKFVTNRNGKFQRWGFKRPMIVKHDALLEKELRKPRYVVIFRDPLAVAMRNGLSLGFALPAALGVYHQQLAEIVAFVQRSKSPLLLASYEKTLLDQAGFARALAEFCGIPAANVPAMVEIIQPNDEAYLEATRPRTA